MTNPTQTVYITFFATVDGPSTNALMDIINTKLQQNTNRFVLILSSPGGSVFHGLSLYNYLSGIPAEVDTHNFGSVHSIAVPIYLAGQRRFSVSNARFLIHPVATIFSANDKYEEKQLEERLKGVRIDDQNIASVIAERTGKAVDQIIAAMRDRTTLNPKDALAFGLVHEIKDTLYPAGAEVVAINMS